METVAVLTVDRETVDTIPMRSFDIISGEEGSDAAYIILHINSADTSDLYKIKLETGAAKMMANLGMSGFAVAAAGM
ncbi:MAG: hypothetical protein ACPG5U_08725 [Planktomarina sp.]